MGGRGVLLRGVYIRLLGIRPGACHASVMSPGMGCSGGCCRGGGFIFWE